MSKILFLGIIVVILFVIAAIVWPTVGLVGYMSIYLVKIQMRIYFPWIAGFWGYIFDMGIVCIAILGIWRTYLQERIVGEALVPRAIWVLLIVLSTWIWLRLPATRDPNTGMIKALVFSVFDMVTIILGFLCGRTLGGLRRTARALIVIGIIAVIGVLIFGRPEQEWAGSRITFMYTNPLAPADISAYLVIALTGLWLARRTFKTVIVMLVATIFATGAILMTGTRGPFLMLAVALLVMGYFYRRQINLPAVVTAVLFFGIAILAFKYYLGRDSGGGIWRFSAEEIQKGIMVRLDMIRVSLAGWARSPVLGTGPGDFAVQMTGRTLTRYPHNLILEVGNELGIIGLIPYLALICYGFRSFKLLSRPELDGSVFKMYAVIIFGVFIYHFVASFKTGSYAGSNVFYLSLGAVISLAMLSSNELMQSQEYYDQDENEMSSSEIARQSQEIAI